MEHKKRKGPSASTTSKLLLLLKSKKKDRETIRVVVVKVVYNTTPIESVREYGIYGVSLSVCLSPPPPHSCSRVKVVVVLL